jgi:hypothetical protein
MQPSLKRKMCPIKLAIGSAVLIATQVGNISEAACASGICLMHQVLEEILSPCRSKLQEKVLGKQ